MKRIQIHRIVPTPLSEILNPRVEKSHPGVETFNAGRKPACLRLKEREEEINPVGIGLTTANGSIDPSYRLRIQSRQQRAGITCGSLGDDLLSAAPIQWPFQKYPIDLGDEPGQGFPEAEGEEMHRTHKVGLSTRLVDTPDHGEFSFS
jgi:hypothetical protein